MYITIVQIRALTLRFSSAGSVCMCVCMCVYMWVCMWVCVQLLSMSACMHVGLHVGLRVGLRTTNNHVSMFACGFRTTMSSPKPNLDPNLNSKP